jgi:hypothetical protein
MEYSANNFAGLGGELEAHTFGDRRPLTIIGSSLGFDALIIILPFPILRRLHLDIRKKVIPRVISYLNGVTRS